MDLVWKVRPPRTKAEIVEGLRAAVKHAAKNGVTSVQDLPGTALDLEAWDAIRNAGELKTLRVNFRPSIADWQGAKKAQTSMKQDDWLRGRRRQGLHGRRARCGNRRDVRAVLRRSRQHGRLRRRGDPALRRSRTASPAPTPRASRSRSTRSATRPSPSSSTSTPGSRRRTARATGGSASSTRSTCGAPRSRASPSRESSPRCSRTTPSTTDAGQTGGSAGASAASGPTPSVGCSTRRRRSPSAPTGTSPRSRRFSGSPRPSRGRRSTASSRAAGCPEQKIGAEEALRAYTVTAAYAAFEEKEKGSLEIGKLADFVVLSDDPLSVRPEAIDKIQVDTTVVGGRVVYQR